MKSSRIAAALITAATLGAGVALPAQADVAGPISTNTRTGVLSATQTTTPGAVDAKGTSGAMLQGQDALTGKMAANVANLAKVDQVVLQTNQAGMIPALRKANPSIKIYYYSNLSGLVIGSNDPKYQPGVVTVDDYNAHKDWALKRSAAYGGGDFLWGAPYPWIYPMDYGAASFKKAAVAKLKNELAKADWDGVFLDDVNLDDTGHGHTHEDQPIDLSHADGTYGATRLEADADFLRAYTPAAHAAGKKVVINLQQTFEYSEDAVRVLGPLVDVVHMEHTPIGGDGKKPVLAIENGIHSDLATDEYNGWVWRLSEVQAIYASGAKVWETNYINPSDTRAQRFARAFFLMSWDGKPGSALINGMSDGASTFYSDASMIDPGTPTQPYQTPKQGLYFRPFTKFGIWVNAMPYPQTVKTYWRGVHTLQPGEVFID